MLNYRTVENLLIITKNSCQQLARKNYVSGAHTIIEKEVKIHPYRKIHPWKSLQKFSNYLLENVLYNKDGLVAINKPYGISWAKQNYKEHKENLQGTNAMVKPCNYTVSDSLPHIAKELGYSNLTYVKGPERYMSGVALLAENENVVNAIKKSSLRATGMHILQSTYWIVTTKLPTEQKGKKKLGIKLEVQKSNKKPVIVNTWGKNEKKRQDVKILNVEFEVLSNSTLNLSSLIEVKASTRKWHAIRLFAATVLYSPVLGDNYHGSRIQKVMNAYLKVHPFMESTEVPPKLESDLLQLLHLTQAKQEIIPTHIHLRKYHLPWFLPNRKDLIIEAPLLPPFEWTCEQLKFKFPQNLSEDDTGMEMINKAV